MPNFKGQVEANEPKKDLEKKHLEMEMRNYETLSTLRKRLPSLETKMYLLDITK